MSDLSPTPAPTRRRWYQFSLRTMFVVVTVFAIWLGWELKFIRDRSEMESWVMQNDGEVGMGNPIVADDEFWIIGFERTSSLPFWRRWLGDKSCDHLMMPKGSPPSVVDRARRLFPEAVITDWDGQIPLSDDRAGQ